MRTTADVVIVGGGAAGLSAALVLGRMARDVTVVDTGQRHNSPAHAMHGFLTQDGTSPAEFYSTARRQLDRYPNVEFVDSAVEAVHAQSHGLVAKLGTGDTVTGRRLLLATGIADELPDIDGFAEVWGKCVFSCPYCHAWELRGRRVGVVVSDVPVAIARAIHLHGVGLRVTLLAGAAVAAGQRDLVGRLGIDVLDGAVTGIRQLADGIDVTLSGHDRVELDALFLIPDWEPRSGLARDLGCALADDGRVQVGRHGRTSVAGVFAAGEVASSQTLVAQVIRSASDGSQVGAAIDQDLLLETMKKTAGRP
ncbi:MAG: NAD(P)/FAD-dependent oxidoreductase [Kibdelosporangium sp.]